MIAKTSLSGLSKQHWIETYKSVNSTSVYRNQMRRIFDLIRIMFSEDYRKKERLRLYRHSLSTDSYLITNHFTIFRTFPAARST